MSVSVLYMSMSLDGYVADPNDRLGGDDGNRLHDWFHFTPDGELVRPEVVVRYRMVNSRLASLEYQGAPK